jgi:glutamate synthase (NADPH) small chain
MGDPKGFMKVGRKAAGYRPVNERIGDYSEVEQILDVADRQLQASRCMDCGVPFCQWGCPIMNNMPEWQDAAHRGDWEEASRNLHITNNFPEFTGRVCPAPCEHACTLNIQEEPVTIRENECAVAEKGFELGYIRPEPPKYRTNKKVAVIGSGPAGLACADLLNKWGHIVTLFEKDEAVGGLLRFGIPDFKLHKGIIDRRIAIFEEEGLIIKTNVNVGVDVSGKDLLKEFDAVCLAIGAMKPRDLPIEGRNLDGVHFAMEFLTQQNRALRNPDTTEEGRISAKDKHVLVIGGGDTGSDCVGTSVRQGAKSVTQIEILPKPPEKRSFDNPWPYWANTLRTSSSHNEGCERMWNIASKKFVGANGLVTGVEVVEVEWVNENGKMTMKEREETKRVLKADLVLLSMGFVHPVHEGIADELKVEYDARGNVKTGIDYLTSQPKVFAAGDAVSGASLVVRAINAGRQAAIRINEYLKK